MPTPSTPLSSGRGVLSMPPSRPMTAFRDGRSSIETIVTECSMKEIFVGLGGGTSRLRPSHSLAEIVATHSASLVVYRGDRARLRAVPRQARDDIKGTFPREAERVGARCSLLDANADL